MITIVRDSSVSGKHYYKSEGGFPVDYREDKVGVTVNDQDAILGNNIQNEAQGAYSFTAPFAPGQKVTGTFFRANSLHRLIIKDGDVTLFDSSKANPHKPVLFTVPELSSGNLTVIVKAPKTGADWNIALNDASASTVATAFSVSSADVLTPPKIALQAEIMQAQASVTSASDANWEIHTRMNSILIEGQVLDTEPGTSFSITRTGDLSGEISIGWRVTPFGDSPIAANDFEGGVLPERVVTFRAGEAESISFGFGSVDLSDVPARYLEDVKAAQTNDGFTADGKDEGVEHWTVELFDPATGETIYSDIAGLSVFGVADSFGVSETINGSDGPDRLKGTGGIEVIYGNGGADRILGQGGDDGLNGGNGNDTLDGGSGDDILEGGFGDDVIMGGSGTDAVRIARPLQGLHFTRIEPGEYRLKDISGVSLGTDTLKGVEKIIAADGEFDLVTDTQLMIWGFDAKPVFTAGDFPARVIPEAAFEGDAKILYSAVVRLQGKVNSAEILKANDAALKIAGLSASYHAGSSTLLIKGKGTFDQYEDVLESVTYENRAAEDPFLGGTRTLKLQVYDGAFDSEESAQSLKVTLGPAVFGSDGKDALYGQRGDDFLSGGDGADVLSGGLGADSLAGGSGSDRLYGGAGSDTLQGGAGRDLLYGGDGRDIFRFVAGDSVQGRADTVMDFRPGDLLDLGGAGLLFKDLSFSSVRDGTLLQAEGTNFQLHVHTSRDSLTESDFLHA